MKKIEGMIVANGAKIGIVAARFNEFIVSKLVSGAEDALLRHSVNPDDISVAWVPGAFEIPVVAKKMAMSGKYDAVICLEQLSVEQPVIMIMYVMKYPRESHLFHLHPVFLLCSVL